jgi:hypothetical protein
MVSCNFSCTRRGRPCCDSERTHAACPRTGLVIDDLVHVAVPDRQVFIEHIQMLLITVDQSHELDRHRINRWWSLLIRLGHWQWRHIPLWWVVGVDVVVSCACGVELHREVPLCRRLTVASARCPRPSPALVKDDVAETYTCPVLGWSIRYALAPSEYLMNTIGVLLSSSFFKPGLLSLTKPRQSNILRTQPSASYHDRPQKGVLPSSALVGALLKRKTAVVTTSPQYHDSISLSLSSAHAVASTV